MSDERKKRSAFIAVGSNLGDRIGNCREAIRLVCQTPGVKHVAVSSLYETAPVGIASDKRFINGVFEVSTTLTPLELMEVLLRVEKKMGRDRSLGPDRVIDLDLLAVEGEARMPDEKGDLELPHPRFSERDFVLVPWAEIAPQFVPEGFSLNISQILEKLTVFDASMKKVEES